jgi:hypothetical protein
MPAEWYQRSAPTHQNTSPSTEASAAVRAGQRSRPASSTTASGPHSEQISTYSV